MVDGDFLQKVGACNHLWIDMTSRGNTIQCPRGSRVFFCHESDISTQRWTDSEKRPVRIQYGEATYDCWIQWKSNGMETLKLPDINSQSTDKVLHFKKLCDQQGPIYKMLVLDSESPKHEQLVRKSKRISAVRQLQRSLRRCGVFSS